MQRALFGIAASLVFSSAFAQTQSASISGTILDPSGARIEGARVEAESLDTGAQRTGITSSAGVYSLTAVGIGRYKVAVHALGFSEFEWRDVQLQVGQNLTLDAQLSVESAATRVDVSEAAAPIDQTSATVGGVVSGTQIRDLPVNGRSWANLMTQIPGAIDSGNGQQRDIRFVGRGQDDNNYRFDGVDATGVLNQSQKGNFRLQFSTEAIAEFRGNAAIYTAESGGTQGGQIDVVSRSGTNQFHGSVFEYLRNNYVDARGPFDATLPPFRLNQFGGSAGGPIRKDRDFFFADYEGLRQRVGQTLSGFVPSTAFRSALLSKSPALAFTLAGYPTGTRSTADPNVDRWTGSGRQVTDENFGLVRYDHKFSEATTLSVRYNTDDGAQDLPNGVLLDRVGVTLATHNADINLTTVLSPRSINEFKVGFNRADYRTQNESVLPVSIIVGNYSTLNDNTGKIQASNSFDWLDTITTVRGQHSLKAGFEIRRVQINSTATASNDYQFSFADPNAFVNNRLNQASLVNTLPVTGLRRTEYFGFVQDEWRPTPGLTANLGVRYEYFGVPNEVNGRAIVFDPLSCAGGYCPEGSSFYKPDYNNVAPRVSLAWSPAKAKNKTVFRAGYGIYYGDGQVGDLTAPTDNLASRLLLTSSSFPNLSYPVDPSLLASSAFSSVNPRGLDRYRRTPYTQEWSFSIQQAVTAKTVLTAGYLGNKGTDQFTRSYLNTKDPVTKQVAYPQFGIVDYKSTHSNSTFEGAQLSLQRNLSGSLVATANYLWSHSINDGSTGGGEADYPQNVRCRACEKASSDQDIRHYLSASIIYDLPVGQGRRYLNGASFVSTILGGWRWSNIVYARTGRPVNVTVSRAGRNVPDGNTSSPQRPDLVPGVDLVPPNQSIARYLNPDAFAVPAADTFGNAGRNLARGPGQWQIDTALEKRIPLWERSNLLFRAEAFNVFNHPQYAPPLSLYAPNSASFGVINAEANATDIGTGTPRVLQFALRIEF